MSALPFLRGRRAGVGLLLGLAVWTLATRPAAAAESTAPAGGTDFASFKIITERNIFSPRSSGREMRTSRETRRPKRVDTFGLVGIMSYQKGEFAFFDGSSSEFRKTVQRGGSIASFKLIDLNGQCAKLEANGKPIELRVGSQLRREEGGEWQVAATSVSFSRSSSDESSSGSGSGAGTDASESGGSSGSSGGDSGMSEILKRLMEQREKETK